MIDVSSYACGHILQLLLSNVCKARALFEAVPNMLALSAVVHGPTTILQKSGMRRQAEGEGKLDRKAEDLYVCRTFFIDSALFK